MLQIILSLGFCALMLGVMFAVRIWQKKSNNVKDLGTHIWAAIGGLR